MREVLLNDLNHVRWHLRQEPVYCDAELRIYMARPSLEPPGYKVKTLEGWRAPERVYIKRPEKPL